MLNQQNGSAMALIHYIVSTYFAHLNSVLIVHEGSSSSFNSFGNDISNFSSNYSELHQIYLDAVQQAFHNQSKHGNTIGLQWININYLKEDAAINDDPTANNETDSEFYMEIFKDKMLKAVDIVTEGFITIVRNTTAFLHARYYATRYSKLRLKDKYYLFLCGEEENPKEFLATEILQFYPQHVMVVPTATATTKSPTKITIPSTTSTLANQIFHDSNGKTKDETKIIKSKFSKINRKSFQTSEFFTSATFEEYEELQAASGSINDSDDDLADANVTVSTMGTTACSATTTVTTTAASSITTTDNNDDYGGCCGTGFVGNPYNYHNAINFELWTQKYIGAENNLNAIHLYTYIGHSRTFASGNNNLFDNNNNSNNGDSNNIDNIDNTSNKAELYPNKLWNLQQRTMRIGSLTYVPYVKTNYVGPGEGDIDPVDSNAPQKSVLFVGSEAEIVKTFCKSRNCHLRVMPYGADNWGIIYENETGEGMLGDLYEQYTEMAIGCVYNWYDELTETSQFIARSAVTILGPGPAQYPRWRINIMPFSTSLWIFLMITLILCSFSFHFIKYAAHRFKITNHQQRRINKYSNIKSLEKTFMDIFAVFIQQPSADTVLHRIASRVFLAFLLSATITLENTYSGQLKSILTAPIFSEPVDTMYKWSMSGWKWGAPSIIWVQTVEYSDIEQEQRLANVFEVRDYEFLYNASFQDDYGLGVERLYSGAFSFGEYITAQSLETRIVPKDDLYFDWTRAVAIRGWPLMPAFDMHLMFCLETGLFIYWERQNTYKYLDQHVQDLFGKLATGYIPKLPPQTLTVENISGPLFLLMFGYLIALIVLLVEIFGHRLKEIFIKQHRLAWTKKREVTVRISEAETVVSSKENSVGIQ